MKLEKRSSFGWGATAALPAPCRNGLVLHYNDKPPMGFASKPHSACRQYWKDTRAFHVRSVSQDGRGWRDIGYSFAVCAHGIVMEGRGWGREQAAQPGGNRTWTSVTFMGGEGERPTAAQIEAFRELRAWLRGKGMKSAISYHGRFVSTSCPGSVLRGMVTSGALAGAPKKSSSPPAGAAQWQEAMVKKLPMLGKGDKGEHVETVQGLLLARSHPEVRITGTFDATTEKAVKAVQRWGKVDDDGIVGPQTWPVLLRVH